VATVAKAWAKLDGYAEARSALDGLPKRVRAKAARKAVTKGSAPILASAKATAPRETKALVRSLGRKVKTYRNGNAVAVIGARRDYRATERQIGRDARLARRVPANYLHLVLLGVKPHLLGKGSRTREQQGWGRLHPGAKANPFLADAVRRNGRRAAAIVADVLAAEVQAEARRLGKR
jgi:HK97 gp10 family phage protein